LSRWYRRQEGPIIYGVVTIALLIGAVLIFYFLYRVSGPTDIDVTVPLDHATPFADSTDLRLAQLETDLASRTAQSDRLVNLVLWSMSGVFALTLALVAANWFTNYQATADERKELAARLDAVERQSKTTMRLNIALRFRVVRQELLQGNMDIAVEQLVDFADLFRPKSGFAVDDLNATEQAEAKTLLVDILEIAEILGGGLKTRTAESLRSSIAHLGLGTPYESTQWHDRIKVLEDIWESDTLGDDSGD
jgi:hypothetical protein